MSAYPTWPRFIPRWLGFVALWLLLSIVFASQLFWAGNVTRWSTAFWDEMIHWFAWGLLAPFVFWWCRTLYGMRHLWMRYALLVLAGAIVACVLQPMLYESVSFGSRWLQWRLSGGGAVPPWPSQLQISIIRFAGFNVSVYVALLLTWHAAKYFRESRERELQAVELQGHLQRAQLQALRSQLNPHFLFNTLHSIAELIHENPALAEQLILRLAELLRQVLKAPSTMEVTLSEELDFIRAYLEIEQMRLSERLHVEWDIGPDVLAAKVPSLLLQPLVENAIEHGIGASAEPGKLTIRAHRNDGSLHLQVRDDGPGLPPDRDALRTGIGLSNTEARLLRLYGDGHGFTLRNDEGLVVDIRIPLA